MPSPFYPASVPLFQLHVGMVSHMQVLATPSSTVHNTKYLDPLVVGRHSHRIVHFAIKAPKLVHMYLATLQTFSGIEAPEFAPMSVVAASFKNGRQAIFR